MAEIVNLVSCRLKSNVIQFDENDLRFNAFAQTKIINDYVDERQGHTTINGYV